MYELKEAEKGYDSYETFRSNAIAGIAFEEGEPNVIEVFGKTLVEAQALRDAILLALHSLDKETQE